MSNNVSLSTRPSMDQGTGERRRKRTNKLLLESYYGVSSSEDKPSEGASPSITVTSASGAQSSTPTTSSSVSVSSSSSTPSVTVPRGSTNLDSDEFDADKYLHEVLQGYSLKDLVNAKDRLRTQAKKLDDDMKTLVYENYHKFVIATETINEIQKRATSAEGEMAQLEKMVGEAAQRSDAIGTALEGKRGEMKHLLAVSSHLKRFQFAVDLPARLRRCIELRAYHEAIAYYTRARGLFERSRSVPAFVQIAKECDAIMADVRDRLRRDIIVETWPPAAKKADDVTNDVIGDVTKDTTDGATSASDVTNDVKKDDTDDVISDVSTDVSNTGRMRKVGGEDPLASFPFMEVSSAAKLLRELGEPGDWVRDAFLGSYEVAFEALYAHISASARGSGGNNGGSGTRADAVGNAVLGLLITTFNDYCAVFFPDFRVGDDIRRSGVARSPHWGPIQAFLDEKVNRYIHYVQELVAAQAHTSQAHGAPIPLPEVLSSLERVQAPIRQVNHTLPFLTIAARAGNILGGILVVYVDARFDALTPIVTDALAALERDCAAHKYDPDASAQGEAAHDAFWAAAAANTAQRLRAALEDIIDELRPLTSPDTNRSFINQAPKICVRTHIKTQQFFFNVESALKSYIKIDDNPNDKLAQQPFGPFLLVLSAIARHVAASVDYFGRKVSDEFPSESDLPLILVDDLKARFVRLSAVLLDSFVTAEGGCLSSYMQRYINTADWLTEKEPRKVGFGTLMFVRTVADINRYLVPIFRAPVPEIQLPASVAAGASGGSGGGGVGSSVSQSSAASSPYSATSASASAFFAAAAAAGGKKFYGRRPEAMRTVNFSHDSVLCGVIRLGLKSMFESVRLRSFANGGFHAIQVDKHYLEKELIKIAGQISEINNTLDDIEMNAYERCIDPTNLEISVIESKLLSQKQDNSDN